MNIIRVRRLSVVLIAAGMVVLGILGLLGNVTPTPILAAVLLIVAVFLAFDLGRRATKL